MGSSIEQLRSLFSPQQLEALARVSEKLLENPEALNVQKKEKASG